MHRVELVSVFTPEDHLAFDLGANIYGLIWLNLLDITSAHMEVYIDNPNGGLSFKAFDKSLNLTFIRSRQMTEDEQRALVSFHAPVKTVERGENFTCPECSVGEGLHRPDCDNFMPF